MPLPWLVGIKRRSVERDYKFYDPPEVVWRKITRRAWPYKSNPEFYQLRDLSFMCMLYMTCSRVSELCRARVKAGWKPSVKKSQVVRVGDWVEIRNLPVVKHRYVRVGGRWKLIETVDELPTRVAVRLPLRGDLSRFTEPILQYIRYLSDDEELYPFKRQRGFQIVRYVTGEFPHYLREMGLKLWLRLFDKDLIRLQDFSGHKKLDNLARYLREISREEAERRMIEYKMEE